jgi:hypothetical protein
MKLKKSKLIKLIIGFTGILYIGSLVIPFAVKPAYALYWEDQFPGNNPKDIKRRPQGFFLFNWIGSLLHMEREHKYRSLGNEDNGPMVNTGSQTLIIIVSGIVGMVAGIITGYSVAPNVDRQTPDMFIGGSLGLGAGIGIGELIIPRDYQVDPLSVHMSSYLKTNEADLPFKTLSTFQPSSGLFCYRF